MGEQSVSKRDLNLQSSLSEELFDELPNKPWKGWVMIVGFFSFLFFILYFAIHSWSEISKREIIYKNTNNYSGKGGEVAYNFREVYCWGDDGNMLCQPYPSVKKKKEGKTTRKRLVRRQAKHKKVKLR